MMNLKGQAWGERPASLSSEVQPSIFPVRVFLLPSFVLTVMVRAPCTVSKVQMQAMRPPGGAWVAPHRDIALVVDRFESACSSSKARF